MDVSIILVSYNTILLTASAIDSIIEKTQGITYEIILVDNNSVDGTVEYLDGKFNENLIIVKSTKNLGFGKANNLGIEIANGKYVFLLNTDTILINNAIKVLWW